MSRNHKFHNPDALYFVSLAVEVQIFSIVNGQLVLDNITNKFHMVLLNGYMAFGIYCVEEADGESFEKIVKCNNVHQDTLSYDWKRVGGSVFTTSRKVNGRESDCDEAFNVGVWETKHSKQN